MTVDYSHTYAVIMAGGGGTRLWPVSRKERPKQLLPLLGQDTLFQSTVARLKNLFPPERILVVTVEEQAREMKLQASEIPEENYLIEPAPRGTASVGAAEAPRAPGFIARAAKAVAGGCLAELVVWTVVLPGIVVALWIAARSGGRLPLWGGAGILVGLAMWWAVRRPYWKHGEPGARKWALGLMVFGVIGVAAVVVGVELVRAVVDTLRGTGPG